MAGGFAWIGAAACQMPRRTKQILSLDVPCDSGAPGLVRAALGRMDYLGAVVGDVVLVASELS